MSEPVNIYKKNNWSLKTNLTMLVVYSSDQFKAHIEWLLTQCPNLNISWVTVDKLTANDVTGVTQPDVVYIETGDNWAPRVAQVYNNNGISGGYSSLYVFGDESDTSSLKLSLRLGASDFFSKNCNIDEIYPHLRSIADDKISNSDTADLTLFINTKGGSGSTTIAVNVAVQLALDEEKRVLLIDLDKQFAGAGDYLNCKPRYNIGDLVESAADIDQMALDGLVHRHSSNLYYLGFDPESYKDNHKYADGLSKLLPILRLYYDYVVIDISNGIEHNFFQLISSATQVCLVCQQNVTSIKHAASYVRYLALDFEITREQMKIVVNRYEKRMPISLKDLEHSIPNTKISVIPNNFNVANESANLGEPIVLLNKKSTLKTALAELAGDLDSSVEEIPSSWIKRLLS